MLENQYYLVFQATPKNNAGLQRLNISTEIADVEIAAADSVWVRGANEPPGTKKE